MMLWALPVWARPLDLSTEAAWELRLANGECYRIAQRFGFDLAADGEPYATGSSDPMAGNETTLPGGAQFTEILLEGRPDFAPAERPSASVLDWSVLSPEVWTETRRGRLLCIRSIRPGTMLLREGERIGKLGESLDSWQARLGQPYARLSQVSQELRLYRATMADIGLQVEGEKVVALILMEPGQLRTQLLRRGDYREI